MKRLFQLVADTLKQGEPIVFMNIMASSGSTPRGSGAMMAIKKDGTSFGTIGGGAVEFDAQNRAKELFDKKESSSVSYRLRPNDVADLGMICGGDVTVSFQYLRPNDKEKIELFTHLVEAFSNNIDTWLIWKLEEGIVTEMAVFDGALHYESTITKEGIMPYLASSGVYIAGTKDLYIEPIVRAGKVYIFGGGHVSQALAPVLKNIGFSLVIFEDREEFAKKELFPKGTEVVLGDFSNISQQVSIKEQDYVVIMTRGHQADYEVLEQALHTQATYIGCIGSKRKIAETKKRLFENGLTEADFSRVHTPIGLAIMAETPEEIAISIAGELILHRRKMLG